MAFPTRSPILMAHNPPPFSVDPAGDIETIGFLLTASGNALLVALVGAPIVVSVNLDCADDEVQTCSEDSAGTRRENQGRADGARNVPETMPRLVGAQGDALGKVEDTAAAADDVGVPALAVRQDVPESLVDTDGDYANLQVDATGQLRVGGAAPTGLGKAQNALAAAADVGVPAMAIRNDSPSSGVGVGDYDTLKSDGSGRLHTRALTGGGTSALTSVIAVGAGSTALVVGPAPSMCAATIQNRGPGPLYIHVGAGPALVTNFVLPAGENKTFFCAPGAGIHGISNAAGASAVVITESP
ncbi:MAG: hypothetical protein Q8Q14_09140 [Gemmatimonadales bacterium]|nr:hypothetical protein [Gemmatimonadales bacterium]